MLPEKYFYPTLVSLSAIVIVGRAFFYFRGALGAMVFLDILFLGVFLALILMDKKSIYFAICSFLSSISLNYLATGQTIYDLTPLVILFTAYGLRYFPEKNSKNNTMAFNVVVLTYLLLMIIALLGLLYLVNTRVEKEETIKLFKYVIFLGQAVYCGYAFSFVYKREENPALTTALFAAICSYFFAAASGYFFSEISNAGNEQPEFLYKVLFRYPGLSTSNFTGHVILLMTAVHMQLSLRKRAVVYIGFMTMLSVVSQSRSVALGCIVLWLSHVVGKKAKPHIDGSQRRRRKIHAPAALLMVLIAVSVFSGQTRGLYGQLWNRIQGKIAYENIPARLSLYQETILESKTSIPLFFLGHGYVHSDKNPHNLFFSSVGLFGWVGTIMVLFMSAITIWNIPKSVFIFVSAQFEILFFTSTYDFLFMVFVVICSFQRRVDEDRHSEPQLSA